jgi:thiosulfate/3-mercaptopyruvate sulfurtransferase
MSFTSLIDVASLRALMADPAYTGRLVLLDCRFDLSQPDAGRLAYLSAHIPGAHHADLNRDLSSPVTPASGRHPLPAPAALEEFLSKLGVGSATQVVAYDEANGSLAARAWWLLNWLGLCTVAVLNGGLKAWVASGGELESGEPGSLVRRSTAELAVGAQNDRVVSSADVLHALEHPSRLLVDARAPERFAGSMEPLDAVAGHVPGAVNHPFISNVNAEGYFLPAGELRQRWLERLKDTAPADVIVMCGSGVTACHNLLAMTVAGLPGGKLYAGSWSEWIRDPDRPVARSATNA